MIICILTIALSAGFIGLPIVAAIYLNKKGVRVGKPLFLGTIAMSAGYLGSSILLFGVNGLVTLMGGRSFIDDTAVIFYLAIAMGAVLATMMTLMLANPLKNNRSAEEAVIFGLGLALPMLAYRAFSSIFMNISAMSVGIDYGTALALFMQSMFALATSFAETLCAIALASLLNKGKTLLGFAVALACEVAVNSAGALNEAFGVPLVVYPIVTFVVCLGLMLYDMRAWKSFPPIKRDVKVRRGTKDIQWPDPGEDGR